jgi:thiol-disulfide isomerase/thioredoxin
MRLRHAVVLRASLLLAAAAFASNARAQLLTPTEVPPPTLVKGDHVPVFEAKMFDGSVRRVDYPKGKITVLLFMLSSCHVCHGMIPEWNAAYEKHAPDVDVLGLVLDDAPPAFFQQLQIKFPTGHAPADYRETFKIFRVPQTIRVLPGGIVDDVSMGHIDAMRVGELFRAPDPKAPAGRPAKKKA